MTHPASAAVHYRVEVQAPHTHTFAVTLSLPEPASRVALSLPVWIPGSYLVREFSQHLLHIQAHADGLAAPVQQTRKNQWVVEVPPGTGLLAVRYTVYAFDASVRSAFLDATRGFFNPTSLCLRVDGREQLPHLIEVLPPQGCKDWELATALPGLTTTRTGFGTYQATDYDELADNPFELGPFWSGSFEVRGVPHRFVVNGAPPGFDGQRLLRDTQSICAAAMTLWHDDGPPPFDRYLFMLHASASGYGGLEHRNATALICQRGDLPLCPPTGTPADAPTGTPTGSPTGSPTEPPSAAAKPLKASDGYTTLLGLISHEYFHTWNVKRLRPVEFAAYDYDLENHTELLWFFEGFTSYYDDLLVLRAGLIDEPCYLQLLSKTINQVLQTPGRRVQTVAQASFEAWTKYYRVQENTPNATVNYYTKGALVALCLDLTLRAEGHTSLDAVMQQLYRRCAGGPMRESDLLAVLQDLGGRSFAAEIQAWVHSTAELPLRPLLEGAGITWNEDPAPLAQQLGLRVSEHNGLVIKNVLSGGAAEAAGLAAEDEWLGVNEWRGRKLDEVALFASGQAQITALVARDGRLLRCPLAWPRPCTVVRLTRP